MKKLAESQAHLAATEARHLAANGGVIDVPASSIIFNDQVSQIFVDGRNDV